MRRYLWPVIGLTLLIVACAAFSSLTSSSCRIFRRSTESPIDVFACNDASRSVEAYYAALTKGDLQGASAYVQYFDTFSDAPPVAPLEELRRRWIQQLQGLRRADTYVAGVVEIEVTMDDGYPFATAKVLIVEHGVEKQATHQLHLASDQNGWKIQSVKSGAGVLQQSELDLALGGDMRP